MGKKTSLSDILSKLPAHITLDESTYTHMRQKARFIDSQYGEFWAIPRNILKGSQHPQIKKNNMSRDITLPISEVKSRLPSHITIDEATYVKASTKARFIDSEYGEFFAPASRIFQGHGHPLRGLMNTSNALTLPISEVKSRLPSHITIDESTYKNTRTKARFVDSDYGEWWATPDSVIRGSNHINRSNKCTSEKNTQSASDIKSRLPHHITLDESTYKNTKTKARFIDSEYGEWWAKPNNILSGSNHPHRGRMDRITKNTIDISKIQSRLPSHITIDESTYKNTRTKARFIDSEYGEWWVMPYTVLQGSSHPKRLCMGISREECSLFDYIKWFNLNSEQSSRVLKNGKNGYEIDIYLPEKKLGIEYHGLYWHSEKQKGRVYHQNKLKACSEKDINLLQIYSDEWIFKQDIVKSIIKAKLGMSDFKYYARKLEMKDVPSEEAQEFLKTNHLMGEFRSAKHIGLYAQETLVSLISYKKHKEGIDISRFCNALNSSVAGGLSKLLKEIERRENPKFIQSWVDLRYGTGDSLKSIGFTNSKTTLGWKWTDGTSTFNRLKCRANMDSRRLTEKQHAEELGWYRIYDAGQALYLKK